MLLLWDLQSPRITKKKGTNSQNNELIKGHNSTNYRSCQIYYHSCILNEREMKHTGIKYYAMIQSNEDVILARNVLFKSPFFTYPSHIPPHNKYSLD